MTRKISLTNIGARPRDGSSSTSRRGRAMSARPIASICCSPPLRVPARCCSRSRRRGKYSNTRGASWRAAPRSRRAYPPSNRFSRTVSSAKICRPSGTWTIPARTNLSGLQPSMRLPSNSNEPLVGRRSPEITRRVVVLPAPFSRPADQVRERLALPMVGAGGRLVEEQQSRLRDERPAQLDQLLQAEGQHGYHAVAMIREPQELDHLVGARRRASFVRTGPAQAQAIADHAAAHHHMLSEQEVLERRHATTELHVLECARDAEPDDLLRASAGEIAAFETDGPALGHVAPADAVEHGGRPRYVGADAPDDL